MKKSLCYGGFPSRMSHRDRLALIREAGFDGVEPGQSGSRDELVQVAELAREIGLELPSLMCTTHWQFPLSATDESVRDKAVAGVAEGLRQAQAIGAPVLLVVPGLVTEDVSYAAAWEISQRSLRELIPVAEETGVTLALENVWNRFLLSPREMAEFVDSFAHPLVGAYLDVGNMLLYGFPHHWIEMLGSRIKKVHVKDFDMSSRTFVGLLQGSVDFPRVMSALRGIGYDDHLIVEVGPYRQYPEQFVRDAAAQMDCILHS